MVSLNDLCDRPPRPLGDGEVHRPRRQAGAPDLDTRTCRTAGRRRCSSRRRPARCSAATCSPRSARPGARPTDDIVGPGHGGRGDVPRHVAWRRTRPPRCGRSATSSRRRWRSCTARRSRATAGAALLRPGRRLRADGVGNARGLRPTAFLPVSGTESDRSEHFGAWNELTGRPGGRFSSRRGSAGGGGRRRRSRPGGRRAGAWPGRACGRGTSPRRRRWPPRPRAAPRA